MTGISSRTVPPFDVSAAGFTDAARDLGEVISLLSGGVRLDAETLSRLCMSMRGLQRFLLAEADDQALREAITGDLVLAAAVAQVCRPVTLAPFPANDGGTHAAA